MSLVEALEPRQLFAGGTGGDTYVKGALRPGNSPGVVTFGGDVTFGTSAALEIELAGTTPGTQHDVVRVGGHVALNGTLDVVLLGGFVPQPGDEFEILTFASRSGDFARYTGLDLSGGVKLRPTFDADSLTLLAEAPAPRVTDVFVAGTAWTGAYRSSLAANGTGEAAFGYRINPAEQTRTLAWTNLNQVSVRFDRPVTLSGADDLVLSGVNLPAYLLANGGTPAYDPATFTATWTLAAPIRNDKVTIRLDGDDGPDGDGVRDAAGNLLDGDWLNPVYPSYGADNFPSGDGVAGGDFVFNFRVLPGDINRDGAVNVFDYNVLRLNLGKTGKGVAGGDINGDNLVGIVDFNEYRFNLNKTAPI